MTKATASAFCFVQKLSVFKNALSNRSNNHLCNSVAVRNYKILASKVD